MRFASVLLACALPALALQPGVFVGAGSVEDLHVAPPGFKDNTQSYTTLGLSLTHRIAFFEPFARAEFGRIHPGENPYSEEGPLLNAGLGLRVRQPLPGGFGVGVGGGGEYLGLVRDEPTGSDAMGIGFHATFQPFAGVRLDWRDRFYVEVETPLASSHLAWAFRFGAQPLAWFL